MRQGKVDRPLDKLRTGPGGYPSVGDQLDALWKGFAALTEGKAPPAETEAMRRQIDAVKAKFPKRPKKSASKE